jgi:hypothetical protein
VSRITPLDVAVALAQRGALRASARAIAKLAPVGKDVAWRWLTGRKVHKATDLRIRRALGLPMPPVPYDAAAKL